MALAPGERLGSYEVLDLIGAGGMGEVYRARDSKLKRDVALKVLPEAFARDPGRMARFQREAEVLASLNHPNIAHIYGVEDRALVMELVDGQTLPCPLPLATALNYARQIAEALEYAHEHGVMHRDLKPGNVKVTSEGVVKLLDFGLAKALDEGPQAESRASDSPTLTLGHTQAGVILGTAAYMSPEQAIGKRADRRADVFSFGAVLYEMLTGQRAFTGESAPEILASVVKLDPEWDKLPAETPASIRTLLRRCLAKDRKQRLQAIGEARIVLEDVEQGHALPSQGMALRNPTLPWIAASVLAVVAGVALWGWLKPAAPASKPVTRFSMALPVSAGATGAPALSRDGSLLAFANGNEPGKPIYLRRMDQLEFRALPGTEGAGSAAFSPDGQWIAFRTGPNPGSLKKIPVAGGAALTLVEGINGVPDLDWAIDDNIYFPGETGLLRVSSSGGKPQTVATVDSKKGEIQFGSAQLLPGSKAVLFGVLGTSGLNLGQIVVMNLQTGERKTVAEGSLRGRYASANATPDSGYIIYGLNGALLAVPFEVSGFKAGSPAPVLEGVAGLGPLAQFGFSDSGTLAYVPGAPGDSNSLGNGAILWVDRQGKEQAVAAPPRLYNLNPRLSPDNGRFAIDALDLQRLTADLWVYDLARGNQPRITFEGSNGSPVWTPDGTRLIYSFSRDLLGQQNPEIRSVAADSSGPPTTLLASEAPGYLPYSVSPDGKLLMGLRNKAGNATPQPAPGNEIWVLPLDGSSANAKPADKPQAFLQSQFIKSDPRFAPDGKSVAYQANDSGRDEIYVVPYPGPGGKQQVSTDGGTAPRWSHDGRELFYRNGDKMMAVDVQTSPSFHVTGTPKMLFEKPGGYDVSRDGKRFLMIRQGAPSGQSNQMNVVLNWFEELRRRAPSK